jgi:hypothetical protein
VLRLLGEVNSVATRDGVFADLVHPLKALSAERFVANGERLIDGQNLGITPRRHILRPHQLVRYRGLISRFRIRLRSEDCAALLRNGERNDSLDVIC